MGALLLAVLSAASSAWWTARNWRPDRADYPVQGVWLSDDDGEVDWRQLRGAGADFAYLTASEGTGTRDTAFGKAVEAARGRGMQVGAVHVYDLCAPAEAQAANFVTVVPRDKEMLSKVSYAKVPVAEPFRRAIVDYHRKEAPGSIVVDSDNHYLYLVQAGGKAIRYGITVGEEAMAWSGIAKIGSKTEWPPWHPTPSEISRLGVPKFVAPGPDNPMGSRALYLYSGGKDTLFRIHGTNQPEYIGASISSGCIRMTNEDVIDLYDRVGTGTVVVVLEPKHGDSPFNSKMALQGGGNATQ